MVISVLLESVLASSVYLQSQFSCVCVCVRECVSACLPAFCARQLVGCQPSKSNAHNEQHIRPMDPMQTQSAETQNAASQPPASPGGDNPASEPPKAEAAPSSGETGGILSMIGGPMVTGVAIAAIAVGAFMILRPR